MIRPRDVLIVALTLVPGAAWPQGEPVGPEFRVNTYTTNLQAVPHVASDAAGNFVVVWQSDGQDGSDRGVFGQRYDSSGTPLGPEFRVNTYTTNHQGVPSVASGSSGNFVVVWRSDTQDGSASGVFGQRYAGTGSPLGPEFRVNTYTTSYQFNPSVASDSSGNFVVVWNSVSQDGSSYGVVGQRYAASGPPLGTEFRVNTYTTGNQLAASVTCDSSGNFVVVWSSEGQDGSAYGIFGQRYAASGASVGAEFRVNTFTTNRQRYPFVVSDPSGDFVVAWASETEDGSSFGIFGQRYASSGTPLGPEFRVNTFTTSYQFSPAVASDSSGNFVVTWLSAVGDGSSYGAFAQRFASSGTVLGPEFRVNTYTTGLQLASSVAADSSGNFVVVWQSDLLDGSGFGIFGQRYGQIVPVELTGFTVK